MSKNQKSTEDFSLDDIMAEFSSHPERYDNEEQQKPPVSSGDVVMPKTVDVVMPKTVKEKPPVKDAPSPLASLDDDVKIFKSDQAKAGKNQPPPVKQENPAEKKPDIKEIFVDVPLPKAQDKNIPKTLAGRQGVEPAVSHGDDDDFDEDEYEEEDRQPGFLSRLFGFNKGRSLEDEDEDEDEDEETDNDDEEYSHEKGASFLSFVSSVSRFFKQVNPFKLRYDLIVPTVTEDFASGAKACSGKIIRYSIFSFLLFFPVLITFALTILPNLTLPFIDKFFSIIAPILPYTPFILLGCQGFSMLLACEIIISGIYRLLVFSPSFDSLVALQSISTLALTLISLTPSGSNYPFYTVISCALLFSAVSSKKARLLIQKRQYTALSISRSPYGVNIIKTNKGYRASKISLPLDFAPKNLSKRTYGETFSLIISPFLVIIPLVMAILSCSQKASFATFIWDYCVLTTICLPFGFFTCSASNDLKAGRKLFASGTAFIDNFRLKALKNVRSVILRDSDIFPAGCASINSMKVLGNHSVEQVLAYSTAIFSHFSGGAHKAFLDVATSRYAPIYKTQDVRLFESGGVSAVIGNENILFGNASFLMRMGVNVTHGVDIKNSVFLAVNSSVIALFDVHYSESPQTYSSFRILKHFRIRPILASLNFQVNPMLVEKTFDLSPNFIIYPDVDNRIALSSPDFDADGTIVAIMSRDNMSCLTEVLAFGQRLYSTIRFNLFTSFLAAFCGLFLMFFLVSKNEFQVAGPYNLLAYSLLWYMPVALNSLFVSRF